jgi:hypothetical protein
VVLTDRVPRNGRDLATVPSIFFKFFISNFRRVLNLVYVLLGMKFILHVEPLKMDLTEGSETSAKHNLTPGKYPKEHTQFFFNITKIFRAPKYS